MAQNRIDFNASILRSTLRKVNTEKEGDREKSREVHTRGTIPYWLDFVSSITIVIYSPNANALNTLIYTSFSALIAPQFEKRNVCGEPHFLPMR